MLRYFNHDQNREAEDLKVIRDMAREWCIQYFKVSTFRNVRNLQDSTLS